MLWTSYFDLGIMHQATFNSYKAIMDFDLKRILEITDPHGSGLQVHRASVHADYMLALLSIFYFIYDGAQTLLIIQTFALSTGAVAIYLIACHLSAKAIPHHLSRKLSLIFPILYLMNFAVQRTNLYEFHAVTLVTPIIMWMCWAYLTKHYKRMLILILMAIISKEQVGFSIGLFFILESLRNLLVVSGYKIRLVSKWKSHFGQKNQLLMILGVMCIVYVLVTVFLVMPYFRNGSEHFALSYFSGSETSGVSTTYFSRVFNWGSILYLSKLLAPLAFTPFLSPMAIVALPEIMINILSSSDNMRNFYYHYTAVITPWLFIAGIQGSLWAFSKFRIKPILIFSVMIAFTTYLSYLESPFPYSLRGSDLTFGKYAPVAKDVRLWQEVLASDMIKVSASGHLAPQFSGRRYFYNFGKNYDKAEYVLILKSDLGGYSENDSLPDAYNRLSSDTNFVKIYSRNNFEVYKEISNTL